MFDFRSSRLRRILPATAAIVAMADAAQGATYAVPSLEDTLGPSAVPGVTSREIPNIENLDGDQLKSAWTAFATGDFGKAETLARNIVGLKPDSAAAWYLLGLVLANQGRLADSLEALDRSAALYELNAAPLVVKGDLLLDADCRDEAKAAFEAAANRDPGDRRAQEKLGILAERAGDGAEAVRRYTLALDKLPKDVLFPRARLAAAYRNMGDPARAIDVLEPYAQANPRDPEGLKALAQAQIAAGRFNEATVNLTTALSTKPDDVEALLSLASAEINAGNLDRAQSTVDAAAVLKTKMDDVAFLRGQLYLAQGKGQPAAEQFQKAIDVSGNAMAIAPYLARALIAAGDTDAALQTLDAAAQDPQVTGNVLLSLGELQSALGDFATANVTYEKLVALVPDNALSHFRLGAVHAVTGDYKTALKNFEAGLERDAANTNILRGATIAAMRSGDTGAGLRYATRLTEAASRSAASLMLLAWVQEEVGNTDAAAASYREILDSDSENTGALNNLAVLVMDGGDLEQAAQLAGAARKADPKASFAWHTGGKVDDRAGRFGDSASKFAEAARLAPKNAGYQLDWGIALVKSGASGKGTPIIAQSLEMGLPDDKADLARSYLN